MPKTTEPKINILRAYVEEGRYYDALRIAAKFPRLGAEKEAITRGWEAITRPQLYKQMGQDPADLFACGLRSLLRKYKPTPCSPKWMI